MALSYYDLTSDRQRTVLAKLMEEVTKDERGCWLCDKRINNVGYSMFSIFFDGKTRQCLRHRIMWEAHNCRVTPGLVVMHSCDVRNCINPNHLRIGTYKDNVADMWNKGRGVKCFGSQNGNTKLNELQVSEIRAILATNTANVKEVSEAYGVHELTIRRIAQNISWKHV